VQEELKEELELVSSRWSITSRICRRSRPMQKNRSRSWWGVGYQKEQ
jgi:hypothetical protein